MNDNTTAIERIARVCHEANRALCEAFGDTSQRSWDQAPAWQRNSAIAGVAFVRNVPDAPISAQHDAWMADRSDDGWVFGPVKDEALKTHPCMVPFEQLPPEHRAKDFVFRAIATAMLAALPGAVASNAPAVGGSR